MARKWMYDRVMACPKVVTNVTDRIFGTGSVEGPGGDGDSPQRPFIVVRAATNQRPIGLNMVPTKQQRFQVYFHDTPGDTTAMDDVVEQLENIVPTVNGEASSEGWITNCRWEDTSGDGFDDHYGTTTRYVTFLVTWRPTVQS